MKLYIILLFSFFFVLGPFDAFRATQNRDQYKAQPKIEICIKHEKKNNFRVPAKPI